MMDLGGILNGKRPQKSVVHFPHFRYCEKHKGFHGWEIWEREGDCFLLTTFSQQELSKFYGSEWVEVED